MFGTEIVAVKRWHISHIIRRISQRQAMIDVLERCFAAQLNSADWQQKLKQLVPSYGESLIENAGLLKATRARTLKTLKLS